MSVFTIRVVVTTSSRMEFPTVLYYRTVARLEAVAKAAALERETWQPQKQQQGGASSRSFPYQHPADETSQERQGARRVDETGR
ncbi:hypothetical protein Taro_000517 [Colocasia esculenta]|uniref:Uncharacterized protein n=1 Tax=Colocasia esculenta TaxID=4460 RepID=A0A843T7A8_COLES|nr:hypothetical protein [Colocasia esculenta]